MGAPHQVQAAFEAVAKIDNAVGGAEVLTEFEGVGGEFFGVPEQQDPSSIVVAATFRKLEVRRDENGDVILTFNTTVPFAKKLWAWAGENLGSTMFADFHATQPILPLAKPAENDGVPDLPLEQQKAVAEIEPDEKPAKKSKGKKEKAEVVEA